jgi:hemolysin D
MTARVVPLLPKPRGAAERAFLPAALEIVETPASPTLRVTAALIALFLTVALVWSYVSKVDIIATAPGKVVVRGGPRLFSPPTPASCARSTSPTATGSSRARS